MAYSNDTKPSAVGYVYDSEPIAVATNLLLKEDGDKLLLETGDSIILTTGGTSYTYDTKPA